MRKFQQLSYEELETIYESVLEYWNIIHEQHKRFNLLTLLRKELKEELAIRG